MRIGELAELAGVTTRTVRHYHRIGLLPEPERRGNGYRAYELRDAVRLLRVRKLVELGLSLDEVADALADDEGRELREILTELDADLAGQQRRIQEHRARIRALLSSDGDLAETPELTELLGELARTVGPDHPSLDREREALQLVVALAGDRADELSAGYRTLLADHGLTERIAAVAARFERLAEVAPDDPAVRAVAEQARDFVAQARARLPGEPADGEDDPRTVELLRVAISAGLAPAQARCIELMFGHWQAEP